MVVVAVKHLTYVSTRRTVFEVENSGTLACTNEMYLLLGVGECSMCQISIATRPVFSLGSLHYIRCVFLPPKSGLYNLVSR